MSESSPFALTSSPSFPEWLKSLGISVAFTAYHANKLFLVGTGVNGLSLSERTFPRCMGLAASADGNTLFLGHQRAIQRFDNVQKHSGRITETNSSVFVPHVGWITGDVDIHDVAIGADGRPLFVATQFNCVATVADDSSFAPVWMPDFISRFIAEDRCHLNGLALRDGELGYATAISRSDVADGWRDRRSNGGIVIDIVENSIVAEGLSMPHSPRLYRDRLWLLESGRGYFGFIEESGRFEKVAFCPGYARGLAFVDDYALVGLSLPRGNALNGLELDDALRQRDTASRCGLAIFNLTTGAMEHWVRLEGVVTELYDVAVLYGTQSPTLVGLKNDEVNRIISVSASGQLGSRQGLGSTSTIPSRAAG